MKYGLLLSLFTLLWCSRQAHAQNSHVYEDSSILYNDAEDEEEPSIIVEAPVEEATASTNTGSYFAPDTLLVNNKHFIAADSARILQNEKRLAYAKNLDSLLKEMKEKPEEIKEPQRTQRDEGPSALARFFNSQGLQYVLWALAGLFVLFILFKLFFTGGFFTKETARSKIKVLEEEEEKHVDEKDFDRLIANAVSQQNYRLATRYLYLQLLQRLSGAGAIVFAPDKTNSEYLQELTGKPYKQDVAAVTLYYEYVWYGEFAIGADVFERVQARFRALTV